MLEGQSGTAENVVEAAVRLLQRKARIGERIGVALSDFLGAFKRLHLYRGVDRDVAEPPSLRAAPNLEVRRQHLAPVCRDQSTLDYSRVRTERDALLYAQAERVAHP